MTDDSFTRRKFIGTSAALTGALAAGCQGNQEQGGGSDDTSGGGSTTGGGGGTEGTTASSMEITGPYRLRMWHEKYGNQHLAKFAKEHGIKATNKGFSSPADPYSKLQANQYAGDNISFLHNWGQRAWENDLLQPIDTTKLDNIDKLDERWRTMNEVEENKQWGIPYDVGIFPLTYNKDEFSSAPTSWDVLWDSAYKNQITMQDSAVTGCQIAALYTGQDPLNPSDFKEIEEVLLQQKPLVKSYWGTFEQGMRLFVNESVLVGQLTVGRSVQAAVEHDTNVDYTVPSEGGMTYFDEFTIPKNAKNVGTSYAWIDDYLRHGGPIFTELEKYRATTANLDSNLPSNLQGWYDWPQDWNLISQDLLDESVRKKYDQIWTKVKS